MFEPTTPPSQPQNPLNPVMPAPGMSSAQVPPPVIPPPTAPTPAIVHTMPERFRSAGGAGGSGPKPGSSTTRKLMITFVVVLAVAGLGLGGLYVFTRVVKTNSNANTNAVVNLNTAVTNTATNLNTNTAVNTNTAANVSTGNTNATNLNTANINTVSNTNTAANTNTTNTNSTVSISKLPSSKDSDSDGVTDTEEAVYTTDVANPDTDGDGFIDGMRVQADSSVIGELANLYNPKGIGGLETSTLVKRVENSTQAFSLLVPKVWTTNESSSILVITPTTQTGEFFQIRIYDNTTSMAPTQWYQTNNPQAQTSLLKTAAINGLETLTSEDGTTIYFFKGTKVYGLNYVTGNLSAANYWTTMYMMMKSFKLVAS